MLETRQSMLHSRVSLKKLLNNNAIFESFLFEMNRDNNGNSIELILVDKCPLSVIRV